MNISDFVTCGFDKHAIYWKIDKASQLIFQGHHNYSVDCIKSLSNETFVTGGQDSTLALWSMKRKKPIFEMQNLHDGNWLTCLVICFSYFLNFLLNIIIWGGWTQFWCFFQRKLEWGRECLRRDGKKEQVWEIFGDTNGFFFR